MSTSTSRAWLLPALVVCLLATLLLPRGLTPDARAETIRPDDVCWLQSQPCDQEAPPDLLGKDAYAAMTPAQSTALHTMEGQAVDIVLGAHRLPAGDRDAVRTWSRSDAQFELFTLLMLARVTPAADRTTSQQHAVEWLAGLVTQRAQRAVQIPGAEYARWAGLDVNRYRYLVEHDVDQGQLTTFLSRAPVPYDHADPTQAKGGFCTYTAPAPHESEYSSKSTQVCHTPCTTIYLCTPAPPTYDELVKWSESIATTEGMGGPAYLLNASLIVLTGSFSWVSTWAAASTALAQNEALFEPLTATVGSVTAMANKNAAKVLEELDDVIDELTSHLAQGADTSAATDLFTDAVRAAGMADEGIDVAEALEPAFAAMTKSMSGWAGLLSAAAQVIGAIVDTITESIRLADIAALPGKLAALATSAPTDDTSAALSETTAQTYFAVFAEATMPLGRADLSCNNSDPQIAAACLNRTTAHAHTASDPYFVVRDYDAAAGQPVERVSPTIALPTLDGRVRTVGVAGNWFVQHVGQGDPEQSLALGYTDWTGDSAMLAWLMADPGGSPGAVGLRLGTDADPDTCRAQGTCWAGHYIRYRGPDGHRYEARLERPSPPKGTPSYAPQSPDEAHPVTLSTNGFAPAGAVGTITYTWQFQNAGCGIPCRGYSDPVPVPVPGGTIAHTWQTSGQYDARLTAVDSQGRTATTGLTIPVSGVPPTATVEETRTSDRTTRIEGTIDHAGQLDDLTVRVDWGDGTPPVTSGYGPSVMFLATPDLHVTPTQFTGDPTLAAFDAGHTYTGAGSYRAVVTVTNQAGQRSQVVVTTTVE
jgi:hypothetical protein